MNKTMVTGLVCGAALFGATNASAVGVGIKATTLGAGVDVIMPLSEKFNGRLNVNKYSYNTTMTEGGIKYDVDFDLQSTGAFLDWHPFVGSFRVSLGYMANSNEFKMHATGSQTVGGTAYGTVDLNGKVDFTSGGYLGVGWGNAGTKGWAFTADIGALYQGSPNVSLADASGNVSAADLRQEEADAEDSLKNYKWYPVAGIGFSYGF